MKNLLLILTVAALLSTASGLTQAKTTYSVPGRYIVSYKDGHSPRDGILSARHSLDLPIINGAVLENVTPAELSQLKNDPSVLFIEEDGIVQIAGNWGPDRINQRQLPLDGNSTIMPGGINTDIYIIDTGIEITHPEFGGRASWGFDLFGGQVDCHGHGTYVAGIAGGATVGVAKEANLIAVRVLDCNGVGTVSGVIQGIQWIIQNKNPNRPAVINMSLGATMSNGALNQSVKNAVDNDIVTVSAAGNEWFDACWFSPGSAPEGLTVAASTWYDTKWEQSNWGPCVDLLAPGVGIYSSYLNGGYKVAFGTSASAPHVAGFAAILRGIFPEAKASDIQRMVLDNATKDVLSELQGSPNLLLYTGGYEPFHMYLPFIGGG